jgi:uncharacterized short protein YbdD (DUF466 family)
MRILRNVIEYVRQVMGEDAYARYCRHLRANGSTTTVPTAQQFYLESLERRYKGVSRCC